MPSHDDLLRHPIAVIGAVLAAASACVFAALAALHFGGFSQNPYADLVVFVVLPASFAFGSLLILLGLWMQRRRHGSPGDAERQRRVFDLNASSTRRRLLLVTSAALVSLAALFVASQRAVEYTESQQFCGQTCHEPMEPHFVAHQSGLHSRVRCVECHIEPGAQGFIKAKLNGTNQLRLVITNRFPRPIASPPHVATPNVYTSCEQCHWPDRFIGDVNKVVYEYADDEAVSETKTTLRLHVGGPVAGTGSGTGIHWHMNRGNVVEYVALDETLEQIPYVRVTSVDGNVRDYFAAGVRPADVNGKLRRRMGCIDCHNRPAHQFGSTPERAVDTAIGAGLISRKIPFVRRASVQALRTDYPTRDAAVASIDRAIRAAVAPTGARHADEAALRQAIGVSQAIYRANVFPSMKIAWGTYPDHVGHTTSPGCFRCHDESHATTDGRTIGQDCELCHTIE